MANLKSTTITGGITEKSETGAAAAAYTRSPQISNYGIYDSSNTAHETVACYNITSGKIVVAYEDVTDSSYGKAVVGTVSGDTISFGTPVNFSDTTAVGDAGITMSTVPGSAKVVIAWSEGTASTAGGKGTSKVGTISGTTINFGAETTFHAGWALPYRPQWNKMMVADTTNNRVLLVYQGFGPNRDGSTRSTASCVKNGTTTLTTADTSVFVAGQEVIGTGIGIAVRVVSITNSTTFVITAAATDSLTSTLTFMDSSQGWATCGTVSGTTVTWNTHAVWNPQNESDTLVGDAHGYTSYEAAVYNAAADKLVIVWEARLWAGQFVGGRSIVGTIDGSNNITFGTQVHDSPIPDDTPVDGDWDTHAVCYHAAAAKIVHTFRRYKNNGWFTVAEASLAGVRVGTIVFGKVTKQAALNGQIIFSSANHGLSENESITFTAIGGGNAGSGDLPGGITEGITYYVRPGWSGGAQHILTGVDNNFQVSTTSGGSNISWTSGFQGSVTGAGHSYGGTIITYGAQSTFPVTGENAYGDNNIIYDPDSQRVLIVWNHKGSPNYKTWSASGTVTGTSISLTQNAVEIPHLDFGSTSPQHDPGLAYDTAANRIVMTTNLANPKGSLLHFNGQGITVDLATGSFFEIDLQTATKDIFALTINNAAAAGVSSFVLKITQGQTARAFHWGNDIINVKWSGGTGPVITTTNDKIDILSFTTWDNGTTWYGKVIGQNFPGIPLDDLFGARGVWAGGSHDSGNETTIDYITIATPGNAIAFGDLTAGHNRNIAGTSNGSRGVFGGQYGNVTTIDYITIATTGDATDFGDLTQGRSQIGATSDGSRGVFAGGTTGSAPTEIVNTIDYITIENLSNATDFGDLTSTGRQGVAPASDGSRGLFAAGQAYHQAPAAIYIDYITIATLGNATDFGDMLETRRDLGGASDGSRAVFGGGYATTATHIKLEYVAIANPGNATSFGDLTHSTLTQVAATSDGSRGVWGGGYVTNIMAYITIGTLGTALDFGDLTIARSGSGATSGD